MKKISLTTICILILGFAKSQTYNNPVTLFSLMNLFQQNLKLNSVEINENYTMLNITYTNMDYTEGWVSINKNSFLVDIDTEQKYFLKKVENIKYSPEKTNLKLNEKCTFKLFFDKIPKTCRQFDFIEDELNFDNFKILDICLDFKQIDYAPNIEELKKYMPEIILAYFSDGSSWPKYEEVFGDLQKQSKDDLRLKNFIVSDTIYENASKLDLMTYSFQFNDVKIWLEKNVTNESNRLIYIEFKDEYQLNRVINCFTKVLHIKKETDGYYTFPDRLFDMITIIDGKKIAYLSIK
jgi:hypothetical protein